MIKKEMHHRTKVGDGNMNMTVLTFVLPVLPR